MPEISNQMTRKPPKFRGIEHIGITVPDLEEATKFFAEVMGCEQFYDLGPFAFDNEWMSHQLNVHPRTVMKKLRFFRLGHGPNLEVFEYKAPDQVLKPPQNSDVGGHHLAFYVDVFDDALNWLKSNDIEVLGEPVVRMDGPSAGQTWVYFLAPWGLQCELVSFPNGKGYEAHTAQRLWSPATPSK